MTKNLRTNERRHWNADSPPSDSGGVFFMHLRRICL